MGHMNSTNCELSIIMAAYNAESYILEAIRSIRSQSFQKYQLIVVDDGSTDGTAEIIGSQAAIDGRITAINNINNVGLASSLNIGLDFATGDLVARLDADDVALKDRLSRQIECFRKNNNLVICGSNVVFTTHDLTPIFPTRLPLDDWSIRTHFMFMNPFIHSTVMVKGDIFRSIGFRYNENYEAAQDYEMWSRILYEGQAMNLEAPLVYSRRHAGTVSTTNKIKQIHYSSVVQTEYTKIFFISSGVEHSKAQVLLSGCSNRKNGTQFTLGCVGSCIGALNIVDELEKRCGIEKMEAVRRYIVMVSVKIAVLSLLKKDGIKLLFRILGNEQEAIRRGIKIFLARSPGNYVLGGFKGLVYSIFPTHLNR